jgi:signal transduction histidine kinase
MDPNTLTLYGVAGGLNLALCLVLFAFAHFLPGTRLIRYWIGAIIVTASGFVVAGIGPALPRWAMVVLANGLMMASGPILYSGFAAFTTGRPARPDRLGWGLGLAVIPALWYWGLVEPNGNYRSVLFSLVIAVTHGRTALLVMGFVRRRPAPLPIWLIGLLFSVLAIWMLVRAAMLAMADLAPPEVRAANPTSWVMVFWYILIMASMSICAMWAEVPAPEPSFPGEAGRFSLGAFLGSLHNKLLLLASAVVVQMVMIVATLGIVYGSFYASEKEDSERSARLANEAMVSHAEQLLGHMDSVLRSVRAFLRETGSLTETERFVGELGFDRAIIHNIYVIDAKGRAVLAPGEDATGKVLSSREFFLFHQAHPEDVVFVTPVEVGQVSGLLNFRISRRIEDGQGRFAGVILASVDQSALAAQFRELRYSEYGQMVLLGTADRRPRVMVPEPPAKAWEVANRSPIWDLLEISDTGAFINISPTEGVLRTSLFKRVPGFPLVGVTELSGRDLLARVYDRMSEVVLTSFVVLVFSLVFALLLSMEAKRRDEQDRFMSMLSHELKTPLSVIRMTLGVSRIPEKVAARMDRAVSDIQTVVERCLQTDRLRHGRISTSLADGSVGDLLAQVVEGCGAPQRVSVASGELPSCRTDWQLLGTILQNLVDNALKYGGGDGLVQVGAVPAVLHGLAGIAVTVSNPPGPAGMPDPARVFMRYYREPAAHSKTGSGLGLHISAGLAELLGGALSYDPAPGEVRFRLWVPVRHQGLRSKIRWTLLSMLGIGPAPKTRG